MKGRIIMRGGSRCIIYDAPPGPDGKRRQIFKTLGPGVTLKQAEKILADAISAANHGMAPAKEKMKVGEYLDQWLDSVARSVAPATLHSYEAQVRLHLKPGLGRINLSDLSPLHLERYLQTAAAVRRGYGSGQLSERSVYYQWRVLSIALRQAVIWRLIERNPCASVKAPSSGHRDEAAALDLASAGRLLDEASGTWLYLPILLACAAGLRRGEVCGLKWSDIDLDTGIMVVRRSVESVAGKIALKTPKSGKTGSVLLPSVVIEDLRLAHLTGEDGWVVSQADGSVMRPDSITWGFRRLAKKLGLNITFHGLRHTHGTMLLAAGVHQRVAMERLRHSTMAMVQRYSHVLPGMQDEAAAAVDAMLRTARNRE